MNNPKIIIFTNYGSLEDVIRNRRELKNIPLIDDNLIIGFDELNNNFTNNFTNKSIILIQDSISEEDLDPKKESSIKTNENVLILRHRLPSDGVLNLFENSIIVTGNHEADGTFYNDVFNIILDNEIDKYERIKNIVFPDVQSVISTEEKLKLLHNCLHPETASIADTSFLNDEEKDLVKKLTEIEDNFSPNYISILTELRKSLLGS